MSSPTFPRRSDTCCSTTPPRSTSASTVGARERRRADPGSLLSAYKRGARSQGVGAGIAIVRAAHVARNITAGPFTRGDAAATLSSPEETFKAADLTGAEIKALLTAARRRPIRPARAFAAGARFSFNSITPAAAGFQVLADGSDRVDVADDREDVHGGPPRI